MVIHLGHRRNKRSDKINVAKDGNGATKNSKINIIGKREQRIGRNRTSPNADRNSCSEDDDTGKIKNNNGEHGLTGNRSSNSNVGIDGRTCMGKQKHIPGEKNYATKRKGAPSGKTETTNDDNTDMDRRRPPGRKRGNR